MVFVQDFRVVDRPFDEVAAIVTSRGEALLGEALDLTRDAGERLRERVAPATWPAALARHVTVEPGPIRPFGDGILVAFSWDGHAGESLIPRLDADLEIAPFGADQAALELRGYYEPPAGFVGRMADRLLLHRLAEATVRTFLDSVCRSVVDRSKLGNGAPAGL